MGKYKIVAPKNLHTTEAHLPIGVPNRIKFVDGVACITDEAQAKRFEEMGF